MDQHSAQLRDVTLSYLTEGEGDAVVLIHGWPETSHSWRHVIPGLSNRYKVIAPDLRGLGDSSRTPGGYDKKTLAADIHELLSDHLGLSRWHIVGHDWGGAVAFRLAVASPTETKSLTVIDVTLPGIGPDMAQSGVRWHHAFHRVADLPELLVRGREHEYLSWFYREFAYRREAFTPADIDEYVRTYSQPGRLEAGFGLYRAFSQDAQDNQELLESGFRLKIPVLAIGGARPEARGRRLEPYESLVLVADDVRSAVVPDSGHFVPKEQPQALVDLLVPFLSER